MGDAKRRKTQLGDKYGQTPPGLGGMFTQERMAQFIKWTTRGSWIGIGAVVAVWVVIRFIGPSFGWWHVE